jgi:hypothetical protein
MDPHDWHDEYDPDAQDLTELSNHTLYAREKLRSLVYGY